MMEEDKTCAQQKVKKASRSAVLDIMKGLAILLMLAGHMGIPKYLHDFIFSFHMPLFFILSGYLAKSPQESGLTLFQTLKKDIRRLLIPYLITAVAITIFTALRSVVKQDWSIFTERVYGLLYVTYDSGPIWFLVALFWCRLLFRPMMKLGRWSLIISVLISGLSILFAHHVTQLPFCFLTALASIVFYAIGWWYRKYGAPNWLLIIAIICWPMVIIGPEVDLLFIRYGIYPMTILGASGGTYVIYKLCALSMRVCIFNRNRIFGNYLNNCLNACIWCGVNTLVILCFHTFDIYCCYVTIILNGIFGLNIGYWLTQLIRNGNVFMFSWLYVRYFKPYIMNHR